MHRKEKLSRTRPDWEITLLHYHKYILGKREGGKRKRKTLEPHPTLQPPPPPSAAVSAAATIAGWTNPTVHRLLSSMANDAKMGSCFLKCGAVPRKDPIAELSHQQQAHEICTSLRSLSLSLSFCPISSLAREGGVFAVTGSFVSCGNKRPKESLSL